MTGWATGMGMVLIDMICLDLSIMLVKLLDFHPAKMGVERPVASATTFVITPHLDPRVRSLTFANARDHGVKIRIRPSTIQLLAPYDEPLYLPALAMRYEERHVHEDSLSC